MDYEKSFRIVGYSQIGDDQTKETLIQLFKY